jgi:hypothetical protein
MTQDKSKSAKPKRKTKKSDAPSYHFPTVERAFSDREAFLIVGEVMSDLGTAEQARELMEQFVAAAYTAEGPSLSLTTYVRDALAEYLSGGKSLDSAFRLKRGRAGRPNANDRKQRLLATEMLRAYVCEGFKFDAAAREVARRFESNRTDVCEAFALFRYEALRSLRGGDPSPLNGDDPKQSKRLARIMKKLM